MDNAIRLFIKLSIAYILNVKGLMIFYFFNRVSATTQQTSGRDLSTCLGKWLKF